MLFLKPIAILILITLMMLGFISAHDEVRYNFQTVEPHSNQPIQLRTSSKVTYSLAPAPVIQSPPEIKVTHSGPQDQAERGFLFRLFARFLPGKA